MHSNCVAWESAPAPNLCISHRIAIELLSRYSLEWPVPPNPAKPASQHSRCTSPCESIPTPAQRTADKVDVATGVIDEVKIARDSGRPVLPLAITGGAARQVWDDMLKSTPKER